MRKGLLLGLGTLLLHPAFTLAQPLLRDVSRPAILQETPVDLPRAKVSPVIRPASFETPMLTVIPENPTPVKTETPADLPRATVRDLGTSSSPILPPVPAAVAAAPARPAVQPELITVRPTPNSSTPMAAPTAVIAESGAPAPMPASPAATPVPDPTKPVPAPMLPSAGPAIPGSVSCDTYGSSSNLFNCTDGSGQLPQVWANAEFLLWWTKGVPVTTPLLTLAPDATTAGIPGGSGSLASSDTGVLLGGQTYGLGTRYGGRFTLGAFLDPASQFGAEASYLFIAPRSTTKLVGSDGSANAPIIGLPFLEQNPTVPSVGQESFAPIAFPGAPGTPGGAFLTLRNQLQSGEVNLLGALVSTGNLRISSLIGCRYLYFQEGLDFGFASFPAPGTGAAFGGIDHFKGSNNFYGCNLGLRGEYRTGNVFLLTTAKVALGAVNQSVDVNGGFAVSAPGAALAGPGGFYALPSNIGHHTQTGFGVVPEVTCNLGYYITPNVQAYVGYTFLYIDNVARPGTQIDHSINTSQSPGFNLPAPAVLVGAPVPAFSMTRTDFWAQGINFGLAVTW